MNEKYSINDTCGKCEFNYNNETCLSKHLTKLEEDCLCCKYRGWCLHNPYERNEMVNINIKTDLYNKVIEFINTNKINCGETIYQCGWVIENAYQFIEELCEIVGYYEDDDDEF